MIIADDDEVRRRVEATLRRIIDDVLGIPCATIQAARRAGDDLARTVAQPFVLRALGRPGDRRQQPRSGAPIAVDRPVRRAATAAN